MSILVHFIDPERNTPSVQRQIGIFRKSINLFIWIQISEKHPKRPINFISYIKQPKVPFLEHPGGMSQVAFSNYIALKYAKSRF